jgi:hypothetical protein
MKKSNDSIGNRSRDLPVCSAVPPRAPHIYTCMLLSVTNSCTELRPPSQTGHWLPYCHRLLSIFRVKNRWFLRHVCVSYTAQRTPRSLLSEHNAASDRKHRPVCNNLKTAFSYQSSFILHAVRQLGTTTYRRPLEAAYTVFSHSLEKAPDARH